MKKIRKITKALTVLITVYCLLLATNCFSQGAAINTTGTAADASAILDVSSTSAGMLIPRMTKSDRNAIGSPAEGLLIYQTDDTVGFWYRSSGVWKLMGSGAGSSIANGTAAGNTLYWDGSQWIESSNIYNASGSVGINTNNPDSSAYLDVSGSTKGFLIPRLTTSERNAINNPAVGLQIFNKTTKCFEFFINNNWEESSCAFNCGDAFVDIRDRQSYQSVQIGNQCWMKENLKYLPEVSELATGSETTPYYYVYGYDGTDVLVAKSISNFSNYGVLYNWSAAVAGSVGSSSNPSNIRGICPKGWHLPSDDEWKQLEMFLGLSQVQADATSLRGTDEGNKLKSVGTAYWNSPNSGATNSTGFTALPGGTRTDAGAFAAINSRFYCWTTTTEGSNAYYRSLLYNYNTIGRAPNTK
ncbi:MAG: hypothetical protein EOM05_11905, partial [Clostridia bacterium]|nr:hypothetical protein [Clostridia bacterium]